MRHFIAVNSQGCTGCKTCEMVCSLNHFGECNSWKSAIRVIRKEKGGLVFSLPLVCQQCSQANCVTACPTGAISRKSEDAVTTLNSENCIACGLCIEACPAGCIFTDADRKVVVCCDLCGGNPQCVANCHAHCLIEVDSNQANEKQNVGYLANIVKQEGLQDYIPGRTLK